MKKTVKTFCVFILTLVLLVTPYHFDKALAIENIENERFVTSYDCDKGTTVTKPLSQIIQTSKTVEKDRSQASNSELNSQDSGENQMGPRMVFNQNEWVEANPYDAKVAYMRVYWKDGSSNTRGTAFFISNDTVVTSAHCIYDEDKGGWCEYADIFPAKNSSQNPYGQISSDTIHLLTDYIDSPSISTDYAIIELERAVNVGYFNCSSSASSGQYIKIVGYPAYLSNNPSSGTSQIIKQYYDTGTINAVYSGYFTTTNTNTNGGSSGGPVLNSNNQVIGIVKGNSGSANGITRLGAYEVDWFATFR